MALPHAQPGQVIDIRPLDAKLAEVKTGTLLKTTHMEVVRMILPQGRVIAEHKAPGEIMVQCLEGRIVFTAMGQENELVVGQMLYLTSAEPHSVRAVENSSILLTILLDARRS
jgi:quercetin dioxygenase-like cupin family protein